MTYSSAQFSGNRKSRFSMHPATFTDDFSRSARADSWSWVWAVKNPVPCLPMSSYRDPWAFFPKIHFICLSCSLFLGIKPQDPITLLKLCSTRLLPAFREVRFVSVVTSALLVLLPYWPSITNMLMEYDGMARVILTFKSKVNVFLLSYFWNSIHNALPPLLPLSETKVSYISGWSWNHYTVENDLNFWTSCLHLPSAWITSKGYSTKFLQWWGWNSRLCVC